MNERTSERSIEQERKKEYILKIHYSLSLLIFIFFIRLLAHSLACTSISLIKPLFPSGKKYIIKSKKKPTTTKCIYTYLVSVAQTKSAGNVAGNESACKIFVPLWRNIQLAKPLLADSIYV